jgi:hypothetical protein
MIPPLLLKFILPKILDHLLTVFKLDKVLEYVEGENDLDRKVRDLEDKVIKLEAKCQVLVEEVKKS